MSTRVSLSGSSKGSVAPTKARGRPIDRSKRDAIVEAASRAFFSVGYAGSSIEQIAADAGVSKVTVYNHFGDKRALFAASVELECEKMRGYFQIGNISPDQSVRERLTSIGHAMCAFLSRPEMVQFERRIAAETEYEPSIGRAFLEAGPWRMKAAFSAYLAHCSEREELHIKDPGLAAEQFVSMCKGMGDLERRFGEPADPEMRDARIGSAVEVFLRAYATKSAV